MPTHRLNRARCAGSIYLTVLGCSMLLTVIGLGSLLAVRVQRRSTQTIQDASKARLYAQSAVELGRLSVAQDPDWRTAWPSGTWLSEKQLGDGTLTLEGIDPEDDDLADSDYDTLVLTGIGVKGVARHMTQVTLAPVVESLEALNTCLHVSGELKVKNGKTLTVIGAPASTNGDLKNDEIIDGDAEAVSIVLAGTITGTLTSGVPIKTMPDTDVILEYMAKATVIAFTGAIDKQVLTAGYNPWGAANPDGVYFIDTGGHDLQIKNSRIQATLIVRTGGAKFMLEDVVFMHSHRADYPVLIVDGDAELKYESVGETLSESDCGTNFNPSGSPYQGLTDEDQGDVYPSAVRGLIYVKGDLKLSHTACIGGVVICEGAVECDGQNTIVHDPSLYAVPPEGYTYVSRMKVSPGSFKQVVD